jgi:hypothetical protein
MLRTAALITSALVFTGCVADNGGEGFIILDNTAAPIGMCLLTGTIGQPTVSHGQISTLSPSGYLFTPLFQSKISAAAGQETARTLTFEGANVDLTVEAVTIQSANGTFTKVMPPPTLDGTDGQFQALFSGSLPPGGTANASFEIIPLSTIGSIVQQSGAGPTDHLSAEVKAVIKPFGTLGGDRVDGTPFQYPVTVCNDCVVVDHGACPLTGTVRLGNSCQPFQDQPVDCCRDASNNLVCPGTM